VDPTSTMYLLLLPGCCCCWSSCCCSCCWSAPGTLLGGLLYSGCGRGSRLVMTCVLQDRHNSPVFYAHMT
jgi:hypothetical protein